MTQLSLLRSFGLAEQEGMQLMLINMVVLAFTGIHWRTEPLGPAISALAQATWSMEGWKDKVDTTKRDAPVYDFYLDWCDAQFGKKCSSRAAEYFHLLMEVPLY